MSIQVPDACTLPTVERPLRQAEFAALCSSALRRQERINDRHLRLNLSGREDLLKTVLDLTARESSCCSFFDFTVSATVDGVLLDIQVPVAHIGVLQGLSELADTASSTATSPA